MKQDTVKELKKVEKKAQSLYNTLVRLNTKLRDEGITNIEGLGALFVLHRLSKLIPAVVQFLQYFGYDFKSKKAIKEHNDG